MVEMFVSSLTLDPATKMPFIIMKDRDNKYCLPIWIGIFEASAIAFELEGVKPQRPMTHDLLCNILFKTGIKVTKIEIKDLVDSTFFASIHLTDEHGVEMLIDARPSDSIALALRVKAPIYISDEVIVKARRVDLTKCREGDISEKDRWSEILENMAPEAFGKYKM